KTILDCSTPVSALIFHLPSSIRLTGAVPFKFATWALEDAAPLFGARFCPFFYRNGQQTYRCARCNT
ncbi:MAG: hypothetical protein KDD45_06290, partial [Bdellovibrionales bacterium]|nr:hypothetical protein [Bdellovibrionales bacterium]